jgi:hypothetical protein
VSFEAGSGGGGGSFIPPTPPPTVAAPPPPYSPPPSYSSPAPTYGPGPMPSVDWASAIASSPYVVAAQALAAQQLAALRSQMGANAARALVNLGDIGLAKQVGDLALPSDTGNLVSQGNKAGTSVLARLGYQHGLNQTAIPAGLAGRGFYRSGETGYALGQESRRYGEQQYSARQSTLDYLNGLYQNYLNSQFGIQQSQISAEFQAYQAALANIAGGMYYTPNSTAPAPAGTTAAYNPAVAPFGISPETGQPIDLSHVGLGSFMNP